MRSEPAAAESPSAARSGPDERRRRRLQLLLRPLSAPRPCPCPGRRSRRGAARRVAPMRRSRWRAPCSRRRSRTSSSARRTARNGGGSSCPPCARSVRRRRRPRGQRAAPAPHTRPAALGPRERLFPARPPLARAPRAGAGPARADARTPDSRLGQSRGVWPPACAVPLPCLAPAGPSPPCPFIPVTAQRRRGRAWTGPAEVLLPTPAQAGSPSAGCPGPSPGRRCPCSCCLV